MVVLYADDDDDERDLFAHVLKQINPDIKLIEAEDGYDAIHIVSNAQIDIPDIVFLDINMPLMDGYETLVELRKDRRLKNTKFVLYSTGVKPQIAAGSDGWDISYLKKGNTLQDSVNQIREVIDGIDA
jgi:CheY-like chemotaxis protein